MKKIFSLFAALTVAVSTIWATDVTFTFKTDNDITYTATGTSGGGAPATVSKSNVILEGSNAYTTSGKTLSCYKESTLKITAPGNITNIAVTYNGDVYPFTEAVPTGKTAGSKMGSGQHQATYSPATPAASVTLNNPNTGKTDLLVLAVTYTAGTIVNVTGVTLDQTSATLIVGQKLTLTATVAPADATNKLVDWTSDNETVATVANGVVSAKKEGTAKITATTVDGHKTATCDITVNAKTAPVGSIFFESFDNFDGQGGRDGIYGGTFSAKNWGTNNCDNAGWTTEGSINEAYQCTLMRKVDTSTPSGLTTPSFGKTGKGHVQFDAVSWTNDGTAFYVDIVGGGTWEVGDDLETGNISNKGTTAKVIVDKNGNWKTFDLSFVGLTATSKLRFYAPANKRAFLDEVAVWVEPKKWDGTVVTSLDDKTVHSVADFEEMTIKLNGATIELSDEIGGLFLGNEDGSELYAVWNPAYNEYSESLLPGINCTYVMDGDEVTLSGWYSTPVEGAMELVPIPETATEIYLIDYSTFIVDGEYIYISDEDEEWGAKVFAYEAPTPTTYTVTYTVTGFVEEACLVEAGYYNESMTVSGYFEEGENTIPENVSAYVSTVVVEGYVVKVKVNGEAVTLTNGQWYSDGPITEDMTIEVVFRTTATAVENVEAVKATKVVKDGQVMIIRDSKTYNVMGIQL